MKSQLPKFIFLFYIFTLLAATPVLALNFPRMMLQARYNNYVGEQGQSFSEAGSGFGGGFSVLFDKARWAPSAGVYYNIIDKRQKFYDANSLVSSTFFLQSISLEPGINFYPFERSSAGISPYITLAGIIGHHTIELSELVAFQRLSRSDSNISYGGRIGLGIDWNLKNNSFSSKRKWGFSTELSYRKESTVLLNQTFGLDGLTLALGFCW